MKEGDYNIVVVDYSHLVTFDMTFDSYHKSAPNTINVGQAVGKFFGSVFIQTKLKPRNFHLIGYSIGSHVMAHISRHVQTLGLGRIGRITALDPARPW